MEKVTLQADTMTQVLHTVRQLRQHGPELVADALEALANMLKRLRALQRDEMFPDAIGMTMTPQTATVLALLTSMGIVIAADPEFTKHVDEQFAETDPRRN